MAKQITADMLGDEATDAAVAQYKRALDIVAFEHPEWTDEEVDAYVWNDGDIEPRFSEILGEAIA